MTDDKYRNMLLNSAFTPRMIMNKLTIPKKVYKYRKFEESDGIDHKTFWKESLDGEMFFSLPTKFNCNDNNDCVLKFDEDECRKRLSELTNVSLEILFQKKEIKDIWNQFINHIEINVRQNIKIGCFTTIDIMSTYMWNSKEFGDENKGYCVEYELSENEYPDATIFLPVSYDYDYIDMTDVVLDLMNHTYLNDDLKKHISLLANGSNFTLAKLKKYEEEKEWRIVVSENNWNSYFNIDQESKRDFSDNMRAVYLGAYYNQLSNGNTYKEYALKVCNQKKIPLYEMYYSKGKLEKKRIN